METEFIDEENAPLLGEDNDDSVYENSQTEIYFTHDDVIQQEELRRREKVIDSLAAQQEKKLDTEIYALERGFNVKTLPEERGRLDSLTAIFKSKSLQVNTAIYLNPMGNS